MEYYGIENKGSHIIEHVITLPTWTSDDEGRIIYVEDENKMYIGTFSEWQEKIGYSGYSGYDGINGNLVSSGYSGFSGYSKESGYSGISGLNSDLGYSGINLYGGSYSGYSGYSGWIEFPNGLIMNFGFYPSDSRYRISQNMTYQIWFIKPFTTSLLYANASIVYCKAGLYYPMPGNSKEIWREWYTSDYGHTGLISLQYIKTGISGCSGVAFCPGSEYFDLLHSTVDDVRGFMWYAIGY